MIPPQFRIDVNENRLGVHFETFAPAVQKQVRATIERLTHTLSRQVIAEEPRRTGRLRSMTATFVDVRERFVRGRVRVLGAAEAIKAGALEYGGPGVRRAGKKVEVKAYRRHGVSVRAYERKQPRIAARRFLRGPAGRMMPTVRTEIENAINQAVAEFNRT